MNILEKLNLKTPILLAPMAGASDARFVATACHLGMLGGLGAGMMSPDTINAEINTIKSLTKNPFLVNLMILSQDESTQFAAPMPDWLLAAYQDLGVEVRLPEKPAQDFAAQFAVLLDNPVPVASFTFGILDEAQVMALHAVGSLVVGTANCAEEAAAWQAVGADAVVLQGAQAGGHQGGWLNKNRSGRQDCFALLKACADLPLDKIAAGGIGTRADVQRALDLGAVAVAVGTRFLACDEAPIIQAWKTALHAASADDTRLTRLFSGKWARGLNNGFLTQFAKYDSDAPSADIPSYPTMNAYTGALRAFAKAQNQADFLSLWAGSAVAACQKQTMKEVLDELF